MNSSELPLDPNAPAERRRVSIRGLAVIVLVVVLGVAWIMSRGGKAPDKKEDSAAPIELAAADLAPVQSLPLSRSLPLSGEIAPLLQATVRSKDSGDVMDVTVREGQPVKKGQVLAHIDTRYLLAQLQAQQATAEKAKADMALAKLNRDNNKVLLDEHFISQNAYDSFASAYAANVATVAAAEAQVRLAQLAVDDAAVTAPFDGVVAKRLAEPGQKVAADSDMFVIVDLKQMEAQVLAPSSEIPEVHIGQKARFTVSGFGGREFMGQVQRINPVTESGSRSVLVYLSVANEDSVLKGGMFVQGSLLLDAGTPVPAIPQVAVRDSAGVPYVYVLDDGKLVRRNVSLGLNAAAEAMVEVREGLKPGERVLVAPMETVKDGQAVVVHDAAPAAAAPAASADAH